jgi:hypothetical protein
MPTTIQDIERSGLLARNQIRGVRTILFFGNRFDLPAFSRILIWDGPGDYIFTDPALARINRISSDDVLDVGIQVQINGLDENWKESVQIATLDGQNKVNLNPELIRLNSAIAQQNLNGDVYIYEEGPITLGIPDDLSTTKGFIEQSRNVTKMAVYSVPSSHVYNFKSSIYGVAPSMSCCLTFENRAKFFNGADTNNFEFPLISGGTTFYQYRAETSSSFPEKTDIYGLVRSTTPGSSVSIIAEGELIRV